jgi:MFS family permease
MVMMAIIGVFAFNFSVVFPVFVTDDLGGSDAAFTVLFSILSVGSLVGALVVARRRTIDVRTVAVSAFGFGAPMLLLAAVPNLVTATLVGVAIGFGSIAFLTSSTTIVQVRSDPQMRGRVLALQGMVFLGSTPIGGPMLGWICEELGARWGIVVGALACFGAGAWGLARSRSDQCDAVDRRVADLAVEDALIELGGGSPDQGRL